MFSPMSKSFKQKNKLNQSFNKSLNISLGHSRSSQRRRTAVFPINNQSFFGANQSKNNNALSSSMRDGCEQEESCFQMVDFKGHVPNTITNVIMDCDACMHLKLQLFEEGVAVLSTLECVYVWNFVCKKKCYELPMPYITSSSSAFDETSQTSFIQAALSIPENGGDGDDDDLDMDSISCVAVTTAGSVFYWKSIAYSRSFVEMKICSEQGEGDACVDVVGVGGCFGVGVGGGFVVGWMSGALTHLFPHQGTLRQAPLKQQQGARLSNISRRVSNLLFGSPYHGGGATATSGALRKLLVGKGEDGSWRLVVMCESSLQLWSAHKMFYDVNLVEMVKSHMMMQGLPEAYSDLSLQDIQLTGTDGSCDRLTVLVTTNDNQAVTHHIVFLDGSGGGSPVIQKLVNTAFTTLVMYNGSFKTFKLLRPNASDIFLYSMDSVVCARDLDTRDDDEEEEEESKMDVFRRMIVGAGVFRGQAVLLTKECTLISLRQADALLQLNVADSLLKSKVFADIDEKKSRSSRMDASEDGDLYTRFKAAFISSMINNEHKSHPNPALINELLSPNNNNNTTINNTTSYISNNNTNSFNNNNKSTMQQQQQLQLDDIVVKLSRDMIDDYPSSDPKSATTGFTTSVILSNQLEDKMNAHHLLIHFLNKHLLWDQLTWTRDQDGYQATTAVLCQHAEKLAAVAAVKELYGENSSLLSSAIDRCMQTRHQHGYPTSHDHFFRQVSKVHQLIGHLVDEEVVLLDRCALVEGSDSLSAVVQASRVIEVMLDTASAYRSSNTTTYAPPPPPSNVPGVGIVRLAHPWTSSVPVVAALNKHHSIIHAQVIPALSDDSSLRDQFFQTLMRLTEHILTGMKEYVDVLGSFGVERARLDEVVSKYESVRANLIQPFVTQGQTERAISLAESFQHFELLVQLNASNQHKLINLMQQHQQEGFPDVVFNWFCKNGKRHLLLTPPLLHHPSLESFITQPPHRQLSWIYYASKKLYYQAFNIVFELAMEKVDNVGEKLNLLSYAKLYGRLSSKMNDVADKLQDVDVCLDLVRRQLLLFKSTSIMQKLALDDAKNARVYTPKELIDLHIEEGYKDEEGLRMAFDLVKFVDPEEHQISDIIVNIWSAAILSDDWSGEVHPTSPLTSLQHLTTYKLISLLINQDSDIRSLLPPPSHLLHHPHLSHLSSEPAFKGKLLALLEYAQRSSN